MNLIEIAAVGGLSAEWRPLQSKYLKLIRSMTSVEVHEIRQVTGKGWNPEHLKRLESKRIGEFLEGRKGFLTALHRKGKVFDSESFSIWLEKRLNRSQVPIIFIIGGAEGLSDPLISGMDDVFSMSELTFPHEMARIVLLEQLYRAFTILRGKKYHR